MSRGFAFVALAFLPLVWVSSGIRADVLTQDDEQVIQTCEAKLAAVLAVRKSVTYPTVFVADCPGGGVGNTSASVDVTIPKALFVQVGGLGSPANWVIENASMERVEDSGGPSFSFSFTPDSVSGGASCSHGSFGGGVTGKFRLVASLRDVMNNQRAQDIGRLCATLAFHPGVPH
jgi:hypothetical protein